MLSLPALCVSYNRLICMQLDFFGNQWYHTIVVLICINTTEGVPE